MPTKRAVVWVVDDDPGVRDYLRDFLVSRGHEAMCLESGEQVLRRIAAAPPPTLLLLDIRMPRLSGLDVLSELEKAGLRIPAIVLSGVDQIPTVVQAMRLGASDYLLKPVEEGDLEAALARVLEQNGAAAETAAPEGGAVFQTSNRRLQQIFFLGERVAHVDVPVLILGESGVGKEVVARYIHAQSGRRPFVKVNCAALPADLLESELFGHERGAFTGAHREKPGKFELAGQGTIMLDEVAEMRPVLQAKLLHILQDGEYSRLGGTKTLVSEARLIAATNKRLDVLVANGRFRADLYFRLNIITLEVPPLRERRDDIAGLCTRFVEQYRVKYASQVKQLPTELLAAFREYEWPGNVRELENAVKRFLIVPDLSLALSELEDRLVAPQAEPERRAPRTVSMKEMAATAAEKTETELILRTLNEVNWNRKKAAQRLGICYKSLLNKLHRWQSQEKATAGEDGKIGESMRAAG